MTRNDTLLDLIRAEIAARGPLSFDRFMELALYYPGLGYYRSGKRRIGERGDYLTSPYLSPLFGAVIGRQLFELWQRSGGPEFTLVEMGAGERPLVNDVQEWAVRSGNKEFARALAPLLVEPDPETRAAQRRALTGFAVEPRWVERLEAIDAGQITGCVLTNELVDSFPARLLVIRSGAPRELLVGLQGGALVELEGEAPAPLPEDVARWAERLPEGARFELNAAARDWMAAVAERMAHGAVLTFDYGYPAAKLYAPWRTQGTLMAFYRHAVSDDLLAHVGEQDLTTHVDFTALARVGAAHGLQPAGFTSQRAFLVNLGIQEAVAVTGLSLEETLARRRAVLALTDPAGLGRVQVLLQTRGIDGSNLRGFHTAPPVEQALFDGENGNS